MQIKRFLGNIARVYLAIGSLTMAAVAGADEFYQVPSWACTMVTCMMVSQVTMDS